jgi:serine protease AprX
MVSMRRTGSFAARLLVSLIAALSLMTATAAQAQAGLLSGVLGVVGGVTSTVVGVLTPGWDDGATTAPVSMSTVASAVGADKLWSRGIDGKGVDVALIDTGVVPVDGLAGTGKIVNGPDISFESQLSDYRYLDTFGHGTHMAGIIAGKDSGSFRGVAPGARIVDLKLAARDGGTDVSQVIAAIDWVTEHHDDPGLNIRVINLSYGTDSRQDYRIDPIAFAVERAQRNGIVVVAAGGNAGSSATSLSDPGLDPFVVSVGAADLKGTASVGDDVMAPFSSRGSSTRAVDVVAPGVSITSLRNPGSQIDEDHPSAVVNERFFRGSGTSQAAAVVSGASALLLQARPDLTPDQVKRLLVGTARPLANTSARDQGAGRIDVSLAAGAATPSRTPQAFEASSGAGSLDAARGSSHVEDGGVALTGEIDIMGSPWTGPTSWSGGNWNGTTWTGTCFCTSSWAGPAWDPAVWTGTTWAGNSWSTDPYSGGKWAGGKWAGGKWAGGKWAGGKWAGGKWAGVW